MSVLLSALRRVAGDGVVNVLLARAEVLDAMAAGRPLVDAPPLEDALDPRAVPSTARLGLADRVLADIDQDGFAFATASEDEPLFNRARDKTPRFGHEVAIVLRGARVCVRKTFRGPALGARAHGQRVPLADNLRKRAWTALGSAFYTEAAALLRLEALPFVPKIRAIDPRRRVLVMDFVPGQDLRRVAGEQGRLRDEPVYDAELRDRPDLVRRGELELNRREVRLLDGAGLGPFRSEVRSMVEAMREKGVAPLDIKAGNLLRGERTGRLYWLDFERARLRTQPRWEADVAAQSDLVRQIFDITL